MGTDKDPRPARPDADPAATLSVLRSDAALNDPSLLGAAEFLDQCLIRGYVHGTNAIVIGKPAEPSVGTRTAVTFTAGPGVPDGPRPPGTNWPVRQAFTLSRES
ncbi:hypothetical protein ACFRR7_26300 [Streptomyces sp. NPDC056909]|uniref:hypothetical protein n=1 Tax=Streptomyces sp. NPDC056909 TaxID=3345963 RepID=UPI00368AE3AA